MQQIGAAKGLTSLRARLIFLSHHDESEGLREQELGRQAAEPVIASQHLLQLSNLQVLDFCSDVDHPDHVVVADLKSLVPQLTALTAMDPLRLDIRVT